MKEEGLDFLTLVDKKGIVIYRVHHPKSYGDSLIHDIFVKKALEGNNISGTYVIQKDDLSKEGEDLEKRAFFKLIPTPKAKPIEEKEETRAMVLKSAYPIKDFNGEILGAIIGGVLLNRNYEIVDLIKNVVFPGAKYRGKDIGTATIFLGDLRISTNVIDKEGKRAIGTRAMKEVGEEVLEKGVPWIQRAFVVDDWYITAYEPIRDIENNIVGMLYVGMLEARYALMKERIILLFFLFSMSGMLIALTLSFILSWKMIKGSKIIS
jgi:two-component system NtrC family sensor kinase